MATVTAKPATLKDFLRDEADAPEGTRLALIDGEIVEWKANKTTRHSWHGFVLSRLSFLLCRWLEQKETPLGATGAGEVRCCIQQNPDEIVGLDVGVWLGEEHLEPPTDPPFYDAAPVLAVEVLSPSDTVQVSSHSDANEGVSEKVHTYLSAGVARAWLVDPELKTINSSSARRRAGAVQRQTDDR